MSCKRILSFATVILTVSMANGVSAPSIASERPAIARISGIVVDSSAGNIPISQVRVMLFDSSQSAFHEIRTNNFGAYTFNSIPPGQLLLGFAAKGHDYKQLLLNPVGSDTVVNVALHVETEQGRWSIVGSTAPEYLDASNSGSLLPDGRLFFCHNTEEPVLFDPKTGMSASAASSTSHQGCHVSSLLLNGDLIFIGGQGSDDFRDAIKTTKIYDYRTNSWALKDSLFEERWYPSLARFEDGRLFVMGGGQKPDAARTKTCEIYDPATNNYTRTDSMLNASEYSPAVLMLTGDVLITWYPPQIYSTQTGTWRTTGQLVQPNRFWPGHSDHSMILLPDGWPMICGIYRGSLINPSMVEFFNPGTETWSLGATPQVTRSQPEVVLLPTGKVLCAAGRLEDNNPSVETMQGYTKLTDIYDPESNSWRSAAKLLTFHEYHATTLLVPDGRVITAGGSNLNFTGPTNYNIEAFEPPYLFRGPRPLITSLSSSTLERSAVFTLNVSHADSITKLVMLGTGAMTHWVDGGIPRYVSLPFTQSGSALTATIPTDPNAAPLGYYILFALVDDVPSEGKIVKIVASTIGCCLGTTGNVDSDPSGNVDISDLSMLIDHLYISLAPLLCPAAGNTDGSSGVDISDLTILIDHLYINFGPLSQCQ